MNAPGTLLTIDTAPRDAAVLLKEGVFVHRRLAEGLETAGYKLWNNDKEKTAFITASPQDRAAAIVQKLKELDAARGGAVAPLAPSPTAVRETSKEPAPSEALSAPAPSGRAPRTAQNNTPAAVGGVVELLTAVKSVAEDLKATRASVEAATKNQANTATMHANLAQEVAGLKAMLGASMKIQEVQLGVLVLFGQQVLNAPMNDFLPSAVNDANAALNLLEQMGGKG